MGDPIMLENLIYNDLIIWANPGDFIEVYYKEGHKPKGQRFFVEGMIPSTGAFKLEKIDVIKKSMKLFSLESMSGELCNSNFFMNKRCDIFPVGTDKWKEMDDLTKLYSIK
jgi:hypothetical protein